MLSSSLYLFASKVIGYGIRILLPIALVRILSKEDFGAYNQFFLLEVLVQTIFQMGIIHSLFYFVPRDKENAGGYLVNSLVLNVAVYIVAYVLVWCFRAQVAQQMGMAIIFTYFWHLAAYSMLVMLNVLLETYCAAFQKIRAASFLTIQREVIATLATLYAALRYRSLEEIFLALIIARAVTMGIGFAYVQFRLHGFRSRHYFQGLGEQIRYGLVLGLGATFGTIALRLHEIAVTRNYDIETYAVYAAGLKQIPVLQFFSQSIAAVALSQFALLVKKEDWAGVREYWDRILGTMYGVGLPVAVGLLLIAEPLINIMFTSEYADAVSIFRLNTLATLSLVLNATLVLRAMDRNDVTLKVNLGMLLLLPPALHFGRKLGGLDGVIAAHAVIVIAGAFTAQAWLNRLAPVHLAFVAPRRAIWSFYTRSWGLGREFLGRQLARFGHGA